MTKNDVFYVASLLEFTARATKNHRRTIAEHLGLAGIRRQLSLADVNHCLSFRQVSDELIEDYHICEGNYDTVSICQYKVPSVTAIGRVYMRLVLGLTRDESKWAQTLFDVFCSPISDQISDFNSSFFFAPADEVLYHFKHEMPPRADA